MDTLANVPDLITETQDKLKKAARTTANPEDIVRWFNELRRRLTRKAKIPRLWTGPLETGTDTYLLPVADFPILTLKLAWYRPATGADPEPLTILPLHAIDRDGIRFVKARPGEIHHTIYVRPDSLNGTMELHGDGEMVTLTNSEDCYPEIDEDFHDLFPLWAAARFGGQDEDFAGDGRYANYMREFLNREAEFYQTMNTQAGGTSGPVFVRRRF